MCVTVWGGSGGAYIRTCVCTHAYLVHACAYQFVYPSGHVCTCLCGGRGGGYVKTYEVYNLILRSVGLCGW